LICYLLSYIMLCSSVFKCLCLVQLISPGLLRNRTGSQRKASTGQGTTAACSRSTKTSCRPSFLDLRGRGASFCLLSPLRSPRDHCRVGPHPESQFWWKTRSGLGVWSDLCPSTVITPLTYFLCWEVVHPPLENSPAIVLISPLIGTSCP